MSTPIPSGPPRPTYHGRRVKLVALPRVPSDPSKPAPVKETDTLDPNRPIPFGDDTPQALMRSAAATLGLTAAGPYEWRAPSPPHISFHEYHSETKIQVLSTSFGSGYGYTPEDMEIVQKITRAPRTVLGTAEWEYDLRHESQAILSFLHLGPFSAARAAAKRKEEGITMLISVRSSMTAKAGIMSAEKLAAGLGIESVTIDVEDNQALIVQFPKITKMINEHLIGIYKERVARGTDSGDATNPGKVLVFCESGMGRSAAVVAAYLMEIYGLEFREAMQYVQTRRFCAAYDDGLKYMLRNYQDLLDAQKVVMHNTVASPEGSVGGSKRGRGVIDDSEDADQNFKIDLDGINLDLINLDRTDDELRFEDRSKFVPFKEAA